MVKKKMAVVAEINVRITGQVPDDCGDTDKRRVIAELEVVCAKYGLDLNEYAGNL